MQRDRERRDDGRRNGARARAQARALSLALLSLVLLSMVLLPTAGAAVPLPQPRPAAAPHRPHALPRTAEVPTPVPAPPNAVATRASAQPRVPLPQLSPAASAGTSPADLQLTRQAIDLAQANKGAEATQAAAGIGDPLARKLVEWVILREDDKGVDFTRYANFIAANPSWPSLTYLQRRAEAVLWQDRVDGDSVRRFFAHGAPLTAKGRFALARALLGAGDRAGAQRLVHQAWREDGFSDDLESQAIQTFGDLITPAEDKQRMDARLYAEDVGAAMRAARRLGGTELAIAKARVAVIQRSKQAKKLLDAVPAAARNDPGYMFSHIQWLRRGNKDVEAAHLLHAVPRQEARLYDLDEWWIERRLVARELLDAGNPRLAYQVAREALPPPKENYRAEHEFTAGWIALRFLNDAAAAAPHFARVAAASDNPIARARAAYWQGRAAEAAGRRDDARRHYGDAARHQTAYYGQLARARLGLADISVSAPPPVSAAQRAAIERLEVVRAVEILYAVEERDLVVPIAYEMGTRLDDVGVLTVLADIAARNGDARATLLVGKAALARNLPFGVYAFPTFGMPKYNPIGPACENGVVYSIARQESTFNQRTVSRAKAMGLMQVTPDAGRYIAKKFGVAYDGKRLLSDPVYNVQIGAAELCDLIQDYNGSYILSFVGYNAGRGRVRDWVERFGDPRDPKVDAVDWVERIPFSETRNYVERVLENLQVYRALFGGHNKLMIEADLRRGAPAQ